MPATKTKPEAVPVTGLRGLTIDRKAFLAACSLAARVCPSRDVKPILQCLKLDVAGGQLAISATNLEQGISITLTEDFEAEGEGSLVVPAEVLVKALSRLTEDQVRLHVKEEAVLLEGKHSKLTLKMRGNPEDFPDMPVPDGEPTCRVTVGVLSRMVSRVLPFVASEDSPRFTLRAIRMGLAQGQIELDGSDGHGAAMTIGEAAIFQQPPDKDTLVPGHVFKLVAAASDDAGEEVSIRVEKNQVLFTVGGTRIYSAILTGKFPTEAMRQALKAAKAKAKTTVATVELLRAFQQAELVCTPERRSVQIRCGLEGIQVGADERELGDAIIEIASEVDGTDKTNLDPAIVVSALKCLPSDADVVICSSGPAPFVIRYGKDTIFLIQPLT